MKFTINPQEVSKYLKKAERCVSPKNNIAILSNFLIDVNESGMTVTASNGDVCVTLNAPVISAEQQMRFCVNAKKFSQLIGSIKTDTVTCDVGENEIKYKHAKGKFSTPYVDASDYPVPNIENETASTASIDSIKLQHAIKNVSFACSNDDLRPALNGIYFDFNPNGNIVCVATDTRRLVKSGIATSETNVKPFIMPFSVASIVLPIINGNNYNIEIKNNETIVSLSVANCFTLVFRQISGRYPNYNAAFPHGSSNIANIDKSEFIETLQRILLFSPDSTNLVILRFQFNSVTLQSQDLDWCVSGEELIPCEYNGEQMNIGFNGKSLLSIIQNIDFGDKFTMELESPSRACVFSGGGDNNTALLMPMTIN